MRSRIVHMVFHDVQLTGLVAKAATMTRRHGIGMKIGNKERAAQATDARQFTIDGSQLANMSDHQTAPDYVERRRREGKRSYIGDCHRASTARQEHLATAIDADCQRALLTGEPPPGSTPRIEKPLTGERRRQRVRQIIFQKADRRLIGIGGRPETIGFPGFDRNHARAPSARRCP